MAYHYVFVVNVYNRIPNRFKMRCYDLYVSGITDQQIVMDTVLRYALKMKEHIKQCLLPSHGANCLGFTSRQILRWENEITM